jgi:uncharacterized repeat protein (TIGR03803 family)
MIRRAFLRKRIPGNSQPHNITCIPRLGNAALHSIAALLVILALSAVTPLRAQTLTTLYSFTDSTDGALPGGVVADASGTLYGFAGYGGNVNCGNQLPPYGCGAVFQMTSAGKITTLYAFGGGSDGQQPTGLIVSNGGLYGTTSQGGSNGTGTVFEISGLNKKSASYSFDGESDAANPFTALRPSANGTFYGTGYFGGPSNDGAIFQISFNSQGVPSEKVLYDFQGAPNDGASSDAPLVGDGNALYGTTVYGGPGNCNNGLSVGCGTFFKLTPSGETVLHAFTGPDGSYPGRIIASGDGNFYGVTSAGGVNGAGTVFEVTPAGAVTTLYSFSGPDGLSPGGLALDNHGNLFGTTYVGGQYGYGTLFELSPNGNGGWTERVLYSFTGGADGSGPQPPFVLDATHRTIYGAAIEAGDLSCFNPYGCGTIFKLTY